MYKRIIISFLCYSTLSHGVCPDGKSYPVTLTFDDGPHPALTPKVLDILEAEKVKGTFFVLGERFAGGKNNPANTEKYRILDRMKRSGHTIASHTYAHLKHNSLDEKTLTENIYKSNKLLKDYLNPVLRLPYGAGAFKSSHPEVQKKNDLVMETVKQAGFKHVLWDIDTNDWDPKKRESLLPTMLKDICQKKGGVILFHDIQRNTVDNLQSWIKAIRAQGHSIVGLEKFVPEANIPADFCDLPTSPQIDEMSRFIKQLNNAL